MNGQHNVLTKNNLISLEQAVELLTKGKCIIFPTETFFALGCKAFNSKAAQHIFTAKLRPTHMPLPLILGHWEQLSMVADIPNNTYTLLQYFWPGPLSILLSAKQTLPSIITANTQKVAVRLSPHPIASSLASLVGEPIIATSANISSSPPVTHIHHLHPQLVQKIDGIINLPPIPKGGLPSTLIEIHAHGEVTIIREGATPSSTIKKIAHQLITKDNL